MEYRTSNAPPGLLGNSMKLLAFPKNSYDPSSSPQGPEARLTPLGVPWAVRFLMSLVSYSAFKGNKITGCGTEKRKNK